MSHLDDLLFIDETSNKGFCSEVCIEDFYIPLIKHYEVIEESLRAKHGLLKEECASLVIDPDMLESVLINPSEVFRQKNDLNEALYYFIKHYFDFSIIIVSTVYEKEASFVFLTLRTKSEALINEFRCGEAVTDWRDEIYDPEDNDINGPLEKDNDDNEDEDVIFIQLLESKKSKLLGDILMKRKDSDVPFEEFSGYDTCFQETLDFPDEVFEKKDNEGDVLFSYIKAFSRGQRTEDNFFYIVTCLKRKLDSENVNVYPILGLPTTDMELCQEFRGGHQLSGPLKN